MIEWLYKDIFKYIDDKNIISFHQMSKKMQMKDVGNYFKRYYSLLSEKDIVNLKIKMEHIEFNKYKRILSEVKLYEKKFCSNIINYYQNFCVIKTKKLLFSKDMIDIDFSSTQFDKVSHLYMYPAYIQKLPKNLTHLEFGYYFNQPVGKLPENLEYLTFGPSFNQDVGLPQKLKYLQFGYDFNHQVDNLPDNLEYLKFYGVFNQNVEHLPKKLKNLRFGYVFNKQVDKLPENLEHLIFGNNFDQKVDHLPKKLKYLEFGEIFDRKVDHLPTTLETLILGTNFSRKLDHLPRTLKYLQVVYWRYSHINELLSSLKTLICSGESPTNVNKVVFPQNIEYLSLSLENQSIKIIPTSVKHLVITGEAIQDIEFLPESLKVLELIIKNIKLTALPCGLEKLIIYKNVADENMEYLNKICDKVKIKLIVEPN